MERKSGRKTRCTLSGVVRQDTLECILEYMETEHETKYASGFRDTAYLIQDVMEELLSKVSYKIPNSWDGNKKGEYNG